MTSRKTSTHWSLGEVIDLARGLASADQKADLERHLEGGCQKCLQLRVFWDRLFRIAKREADFEPPSGAVRSAKALFSALPQTGPTTGIRKVARLIYDSCREPLPAGIRTIARGARQVMYKAGTFVVDLRLESQPDNNRVCLVGQILRQADPLKSVEDVPVLLVQENSNVAETTTNSFGEFQLEFEPNKKNRLSLVLNENRAIVIPSKGLEVPTADKLDRARTKSARARTKSEAGQRSGE